MFTSLLPLLPLLPFALALTNEQGRQRSVYQIITDRFALTDGSSPSCSTDDKKYCGGTWKGIENKLDYVQGMGFDTVWISPVVENIGGTTGLGEAYHGYWTLNPENLNNKFGTADDLKSLASALHSKGMYLMVDVVVNHVAATSSSTFAPSDAYGPFAAQDDYHPFCWIEDYSNQTQVEQCWLGDSSVALPDLNTQSSTVRDYWNGWVKDLVSNYSVDAIRIDTVKHVEKDFFPNFVAAANVWNVGEILEGGADYVAAYQKDAQVNPFNYPIYFPLIAAFNTTSGSMSALVDMVSTVKSDFVDPTLLGTFLDNHDNPRFESYQSDAALIKNAQTYPLVTDGIPYVYYGSEDGFNGGADPANREPLWTSKYATDKDMYKHFATLNKARSAAFNASSSFYTNQMSVAAIGSNEIAINKAPMFSILSNRGANSGNNQVTVSSQQSGFAANDAVVDVLSCESMTVDGSGNLAVTVANGAPRVFLKNSDKGSLCGSTTSTSTPQGGAIKTGGAGVGLIAALGAVMAIVL